MSVNAMSAGAVNLQSLDLGNMDIETMLMMVQSRRADLLDSQLKTQIEEVQGRNDQIGKLNDVVASLQKLYAKADKNGDCSGDNTLNLEVNRGLESVGYTGGWGAVGGGTKRENVDSIISKLKNQIDGLNNSNQMDMLRLQSMTNKRNEAFDTMTNFIKKMQDSRSSIIGNMR